MAVSCTWVTYVGPYLLDGLEGRDKVAFTAHLDGCPVCQFETRELAGVARQLRSVDASQLHSATTGTAVDEWDPPARLRTTVLGAVERLERVRRRRVRLALAGAAAALVAVLAVTSVALRSNDSVKSHTRRYDLLAGPGSSGYAVAGFVDVGTLPTGTYVEFHAKGLPKGALYRMWFETPDGTRVPIGSFTAVGGSTWFVCEATAGLGMDAVAAVGASDKEGKTVLRADFPKAKSA